MPYIKYPYYGFEKKEKGKNVINFVDGWNKIAGHPLFSFLDGEVILKKMYDKNTYAKVRNDGNIYVNYNALLTAGQWAYVLAHCLLHLAFGHFDKKKLPQEGEGDFSKELWNQACDIYLARLLADIKWGEPLADDPAKHFPIKLNNEQRIYDFLKNQEGEYREHLYGTADTVSMDMQGLDKPLEYANGEKNSAEEAFIRAMKNAVEEAVRKAGNLPGRIREESEAGKAAQWFINHYPLLGGLAASFQIEEKQELCWRYDIQIAAVDAIVGKIYVNLAAGLTEEEWKFVLAHEYLHAALQHHNRLQGRNAYLWNIATDFVINGWLKEMKIGEMPEGVLFDEAFLDMSAEAVYDEILKDARRFGRMKTLRGYGKPDLFIDGTTGYVDGHDGLELDKTYRNALVEGWNFQNYHGRGYVPAGLLQEIQALSEPPVPWEIELGVWFDENFPPIEKVRTYARPSRRQGSTPDIPRPRYIYPENGDMGRTFAVVIDTSGSMGIQLIAKALGATASYAVARDVLHVRVVFCDTEAYDAGYLEPREIAGKVEVKGGGGTVLQSAINLLNKAKDFPKDGPVLIITDGYIEDDLKVNRKHTFLIPKGYKLPFGTKEKVFYLA